jgi:hypothetical protein
MWVVFFSRNTFRAKCRQCPGQNDASKSPGILKAGNVVEVVMIIIMMNMMMM